MTKTIATMGPAPSPSSLSPALGDTEVDCDGIAAVVTVDVVDFVSNSYLFYKYK